MNSCFYCTQVYATASDLAIHTNNKHTMRPITEREPTPTQSEFEKFFAQNDIKLVAYSQEMPFRESGFRVVITPKETT